MIYCSSRTQTSNKLPLLLVSYNAGERQVCGPMMSPKISIYRMYTYEIFASTPASISNKSDVTFASASDRLAGVLIGSIYVECIACKTIFVKLAVETVRMAGN